MFLNNYHYIRSNFTSASQHQDLWHYLPGYYLFILQSGNGAQFVNNNPLSPLFICLDAALSPAPVIVMVPLSIHHCNHINLTLTL